MGMMGSGKSSMRSIIFANFIARDTRRLGPTINVEQSNVNFMGGLILNLWDCGAQDIFMESYFTSQREHIFSNVGVLIYVVDIENRESGAKDMNYFKSCLESLQQYSKNAKVFCLVHKMDLLPEPEREPVFKHRESQLQKLAGSMEIKCFRTSIWDETLYKAWSSIVYSMIPNIKQLEEYLNMFLNVCEADQVVLFEKSTFLVVSHVSKTPQLDIQLFEKISTIIKQFKLSCARSSQAQFQSMQMEMGEFTAFIEGFTSNTFVMVITSDPVIKAATTLLNIDVARPHFEKLILQNEPPTDVIVY